jgi:hypothetical protein
MGDGKTNQMINEANEPGPVVPETDSAQHAETPSPEHIVADGGTSGDTEEGTPLAYLVKGRKRKLALVVGRRYVLPDKDEGEGVSLPMVFSEFAEGIYTFTDERGEGEYGFSAEDLRKLQPYADWNGQAGTPAESSGGTETGLPERSITAPTTSVTGVTEASLAIFPVANYSKHTDDELHQVNLDNLAEFDRLREKLESYAYEKVLPALNETIERFNRQGCRMGGKSEIAEYLTSIGYNYATVRKWNERCRKRLLKAAAPTKPAPSNPLTPDQQVVAEALEAQGCKKGEARNLAKAATGNTFQERFKSALAGRVEPPTMANKPDKVGAEPVPAITVESPQPSPNAVGEPSQWPPTPNKNEKVAVPAVCYKSPQTQSVSLPKPGDCSGLVSNISQLCGDHLKAGLEGLEPEVMTQVFGRLVQRLAQMYCIDASGSAVELTVTVQKIARKAPMSCNEIREEWRFAT